MHDTAVANKSTAIAVTSGPEAAQCRNQFFLLVLGKGYSFVRHQARIAEGVGGEHIIIFIIIFCKR